MSTLTTFIQHNIALTKAIKVKAYAETAYRKTSARVVTAL